jgi:hypothetical protein
VYPGIDIELSAVNSSQIEFWFLWITYAANPPSSRELWDNRERPLI